MLKLGKVETACVAALEQALRTGRNLRATAEFKWRRGDLTVKPQKFLGHSEGI
jgi:hypothetical protein